MSRDIDRHQCPIAGHTELLPLTRLMCPAAWYLVPPDLQRAVNAAYDHGYGTGTEALYAAQDAAIQAAETKLAARKDPR